MNYQQALNAVRERRPTATMKKVAGNTWIHIQEDNTIILRFHTTDIITWLPNGDIILQSGGYHTVTTKKRINFYTPTGILLFQKQHEWFISLTTNKGIRQDYDFEEPFRITQNPRGHFVKVNKETT